MVLYGLAINNFGVRGYIVRVLLFVFLHRDFLVELEEFLADLQSKLVLFIHLISEFH